MPLRAPRRTWKRIAIALVAPVVFLGVCEIGLAIAGFGAPNYYGLPPGVSTYWVPFKDERGEFIGYRRAFPRKYTQYLESRPLFVRNKPESGFRVFTLGESSVEGSPYEIGSFTDWLRVRLTHMMPGRFVEVVNGGNPGWHATETRKILQESLDHGPDLFVWMLGHNEHVPENILRLREEVEHPVSFEFKALIRGLRTANFLSQWIPISTNRRHSTFDRATISDTQCYGSEYPLLKKRFVEAYTGALRDAKDHNVTIIACTMPRNLRDAAPSNYYFTKEVFRDPPTLRRWQSLFDQGSRSLDQGQASQAMEYFSRAEAIDPTPALLHFKIAKAQEKLGNVEAARARYMRALEQEACSQRAPPWIEDAIREITAREEVPLVDLERMFNAKNPIGVAGSELICDNMHPSLRGHEVIAEAILETLGRDARIPLDRSRDITLEQGRAELGLDRYGATLSSRAEVLFNVKVVVQSGATDDLWKRNRETCRQLLRDNPKDWELAGALGCFEAVGGNLPQAKKWLETAMANSEHVLTNYLFYCKTEALFQQLFARIGIDMAAVERGAKPQIITTVNNRISRRGR